MVPVCWTCVVTGQDGVFGSAVAQGPKRPGEASATQAEKHLGGLRVCLFSWFVIRTSVFLIFSLSLIQITWASFSSWSVVKCPSWHLSAAVATLASYGTNSTSGYSLSFYGVLHRPKSLSWHGGTLLTAALLWPCMNDSDQWKRLQRWMWCCYVTVPLKTIQPNWNRLAKCVSLEMKQHFKETANNILYYNNMQQLEQYFSSPAEKPLFTTFLWLVQHR